MKLNKLKAIALVSVILSAVTAAAGGERPAMPQVFLDTKYVQPTGRTIRVDAGDDFQDALDAARPGDEIVLEAGAVFTDNFVLRNKGPKEDARWITIRSSQMDGLLPPEGTRVSPADTASMPRVLSKNAGSVLKASAGAHHYRFIGIEFSITNSVSRISSLITLGDDDQTSLDAIPHDIIFDRCYIHGTPTANVRRGIALNSARTSVVDSYISDCHERGADSQAICGWAGPGPFKIVNNYLEGAGENILFGGADAKIEGLVPSDIEIRRNHFSKQLSWKEDDPSYAGIDWSIKNIFELKNARRVFIDGNLFEHNWHDSQVGYAILFKSANSSGRATWSVTEDVTFTNNIVRHTAAGINILGRDFQDQSEQVKRILIGNNLFYDIDKDKWGGDGVFMKLTDSLDVTVENNTVIHTGTILLPYGEANVGFTFMDNIMPHNKFGIKGDSEPVGNGTVERYFPGGLFKNNVIAGGQASRYPTDNFFPASLDEVKFIDRPSDDYRLKKSSPYFRAGREGKAVGANIKAIEKAYRKDYKAPSRQ
jgi:hypothetical protein